MQQPIYSEPRFSAQIFFILLLLTMCISWVAFILLNTLKAAKKERIEISPKESSMEKKNEQHKESSGAQVQQYETQPVESVSTVEQKFYSQSHLLSNSISRLSRERFIGLLITQSFICALTNGVLPAIQTYSCLPYGNLAYHFAITLASMSNPIACFFAFFFSPNAHKRSLPIVIIFGLLCGIYIIITAIYSPNPPLVNNVSGKVLIVMVWICFTSLFSYAKACIAHTLRNVSKGHKALFICGVFTQIGSAIGSIIMFILVNYTHIFTAYYPCT
jgi:riboflavin transporter 2